MRFHPKRRASTDQAPGPSSARAAPKVPNRMGIEGSPACERMFHSSMSVTTDPAIGVHRPTTNSIPDPAPST